MHQHDNHIPNKVNKTSGKKKDTKVKRIFSPKMYLTKAKLLEIRSTKVKVNPDVSEVK